MTSRQMSIYSISWRFPSSNIASCRTDTIHSQGRTKYRLFPTLPASHRSPLLQHRFNPPPPPNFQPQPTCTLPIPVILLLLISPPQGEARISIVHMHLVPIREHRLSLHRLHLTSYRLLFNHAWNTVRDHSGAYQSGAGPGVAINEARHWHHRAYGSIVRSLLCPVAHPLTSSTF